MSEIAARILLMLAGGIVFGIVIESNVHRRQKKTQELLMASTIKRVEESQPIDIKPALRRDREST